MFPQFKTNNEPKCAQLYYKKFRNRNFNTKIFKNYIFKFKSQWPPIVINFQFISSPNNKAGKGGCRDNGNENKEAQKDQSNHVPLKTNKFQNYMVLRYKINVSYWCLVNSEKRCFVLWFDFHLFRLLSYCSLRFQNNFVHPDPVQTMKNLRKQDKNDQNRIIDNQNVCGSRAA